MRHRPITRTAAALLAFTLAGAVPLGVRAQSAADGWRWDASLYFWLPTVGGRSSYPADGGGSSVDISAQQVIDALQFMAMGSLSARKGEWGVWSDLAYANFGATQQASRDFSIAGRPLPGGVDAKLDLDFQAMAWTLAGTYALVSSPTHQVDLLAGTRALNIHQTLGWAINGNLAGTGLLNRNGSSSVDQTNWDAIVGIKGRANLGADRRWFVPYHLDVGGGQSDLTWQANLGLGYQFGWGAVVASYRYLAYEMKSGQPVRSLNFSGPVVGVAWQW